MEHLKSVSAGHEQNGEGWVSALDDVETREGERDYQDTEFEGQSSQSLERQGEEYLETVSPTAEVTVDDATFHQHIESQATDEPLNALIDSIESDQPHRPISATPDADEAVTALNENHALITSIGEIFRFARNDFVKMSTFHLEHSNKYVEADIAGKLKMTTLSEAWLKSPHRRHYEDVDFMPGQPRIVDNKVNLWQGWGCGRVAGDITPWSELLDYVFGDDAVHRKWFEQWVAYPIKNPGFKLNAVVVMWSAQQGVGKTLIGQTIGRIYGSGNYSEITTNDLRGRFNNWSKGCQFILGEEISIAKYFGESGRLKHLFTGETIQMEEKYKSKMPIKNCINFLFTSNNPDAFLIDSHDRRYFVWEVQGKPLEPSFYSDFVDWRDQRGGAAALMEHFSTMDLSDFDPKARAPTTAAKVAMIEASRSDLEQWLATLRNDPQQAQDMLGCEIITLEDLTDVYNLRTKNRAKPLDIGKTLLRLGPCKKRRAMMGSGYRPVLHAVCRVEHWSEMDNPEWAEEARKFKSPTAPGEPSMT